MNLFGQYESQETRALRSIDSSKYPDTNRDLEQNLMRLNSFVDYIAQYLQIMQKGVDKANQDALQRGREILQNIGILLGGGTIMDVDFGDLQYFLPAMGALFGFDANTPFPINLFHAAENFFLGYVVPLDSFGYVVSDQIISWAQAFGLNEDFINALSDLLNAFSSIGITFSDFFNELFGLLNIFGINSEGLGPFANLWHSITVLLGGFSLETIGDITDPIFATFAPWIAQLAEGIAELNQIIEAFAGGVLDIAGMLNFAHLFDGIDFTAPDFNVFKAMEQWINQMLLPTGLFPSWGDLWEQLTGQPGGDIETLGDFLRQALFGPVDPSRLPSIPMSSLNPFITPNLLEAPTFDAAISVDGKGVWNWDDTVGRTGFGSTVVTLDGVSDRLLWSNEIPVAKGDVLDFTVYYRTENIVGSATAIGIDAILFNSGSVVGERTLTTAEGTTDPQRPQWRKLAAELSIPDNCDSIRMQLRVNTSARSGKVWFDDGSVTKERKLIPQAWVDHLPGDLADIINGIGQGASNIFEGIFTPIDLRELINNLLRSTQDANASIAEILNRVKPQGGVSSDVRFDIYPNGPIPPEFRQIFTLGQGSVVVKNGCLDWQDQGNLLAQKLYLYEPTTLATDIFEVSIVVPRQAEGREFANPCYNFLIGGANAAGTEYCIVRFGNEGFQFGYAAGGAIQWLAGFGSVKPPAGSAIRFRGEKVNGKVKLSAYANNRPVVEYTDRAGVLVLDGSHRKCGLGFQAHTKMLGQATPGNVAIFLMSDGMPPESEVVL